MLGCQREESKTQDSEVISSSGVMIVDEVCSVTQGYETEGQRVTVRGSLNAITVGDYYLFNSQWDPFDPEAGKDIPRISVQFREGENPDEHLGWYVDITGVIATSKQDLGKIAVILDNAVIEPVPVGESEEMTPRTKKTNKAEMATPRKPSD